ncbi:MAG: hypothetical protein LBE08_00025, partial [Bifidobacteriaceae bacterium]|nr:hypothetical protein [Bifidobacteriaceae bacterium]
MTDWGGIAPGGSGALLEAAARPGAARPGAARPRAFPWPAVATALASWVAMVVAWFAPLDVVFAVGATMAAGF